MVGVPTPIPEFADEFPRFPAPGQTHRGRRRDSPTIPPNGSLRHPLSKCSAAWMPAIAGGIVANRPSLNASIEI
jgi:hypothetical protein